MVFLQQFLGVHKLFVLLFCCTTLFSTEKPIRLLHLTFHKGCMREVEGIAKNLGIELTTWFIHDLPSRFFDGTSQSSALYNIGYERAERIWQKHKNFFNKFDAIITSDTAPLARIFLQSGCTKPLIIWICNRFDYADQASLDCLFPDQHYYDLFTEATKLPHVTIVAYTPFEHYYAKSKGIDTGTLTIKPCASYVTEMSGSSIPSYVNKSQTFFLPPYHNETHFIDLPVFLRRLGIPSFRGRYNGPYDLKDFRAIIHLPYSWSNLAFFENIQLGIPYCIPTPSFMQRLALSGNYFHPNIAMLFQENLFYLSEWYAEENRAGFVYFDSWKDLRRSIDSIDFVARREQVRRFADCHKQIMLERWRQVFEKIRKRL